MAAKILVLDDEADFERLILQRFRRKVRSNEYEFTFAQNGKQALDLLAEGLDSDIILCDINMPQMDGLTFLSKLKDNQKKIRAVMVSAYGDLDNIRAAMNLGAYDFVTKPIDFQDLEATIEKTLREVEEDKRAVLAQKLESRNEQLEELDRLKSEFFTNISHELRTPLTVIRGMTDQIKEKPERWFNQGLEMIRRNSTSMMKLVNQMLDLSKLESGKLQLSLINDDVIKYLRYIIESFKSLAENKQIQLQFKTEVKECFMDYDPDWLLVVFSNLLSNAIKFTPSDGKITVEIGAPQKAEARLQIKIIDTGIGIPEDQIPFIFNRFHQVDRSIDQQHRGTGIGLALTQELIHLMDGSIEVSSEMGKGSIFQIELPIRNKAKKPKTALVESEAVDQAIEILTTEAATEKSSTFANETISNAREEELPTLLIVEDTPDIVDYLRACLESQYNLLIARNGQEGIDRAIEEVPDIIISDVMMPKKDGFELCQILKEDERTSHIPIILLTAMADQSAKIGGLTRGADAYLTKPFDQEELEVRLTQLLALRAKLQTRYQQLDSLAPSEDVAVKQEDAFLMRVRAEVEENLDDEDLSIAGLSRAIGVSRAQLHNKIKALTGHSPSVFVRNIRLYKAKELLKNTDLNISQIAFEVGFRDPAYFSRTFSDTFGQSPKEMR